MKKKAPNHMVDVALGERSYPIHIGAGICEQIATLVPLSLAGRTLFILTDENIARHGHMETVITALEQAGAENIYTLILSPGEASKSLTSLNKIWDWLLEGNVDRQSILFAVGGGVVGDVAGFAASTILRSIPYIQIPTTLLAQIDSSVGGKTAINMPQGKNLVGAFYQPAAVLCDTSFLSTLPQREVLAGYAEVVKYGLINDPEFFIWLESKGAQVCRNEAEAVAYAVTVSCKKKAEIVAEDEKESGIRALLNLGHTFGHAIEALGEYNGNILHGEAVAVGIILAFRLSARLGHCPEADVERVVSHFKKTGLPTSIKDLQLLENDPNRVIAAMAHDKKAVGRKKIFILVRGIGKAYIDDSVADRDLIEVISHSMKGI